MKHDIRAWDWPLQPKDGLVMLVNDGQRFEADLEMPTFKAEEVDVSLYFFRDETSPCLEKVNYFRFKLQTMESMFVAEMTTMVKD